MMKTPSVYKLKILFIGPVGAGKTTFANFLADATESSEEYRPTSGVRILEFETPSLNVQNKSIKAEVELWDCSGNRRYESCWAAFRQDAQGVVFIADPSQGSIAEVSKQLEIYYEYFVRQPGLSPSCCLVLVNSKQNLPLGKVPQLLSANTRILQIIVDMDESSNKLKSDFNGFITNVLNTTRLTGTGTHISGKEEISTARSVF